MKLPTLKIIFDRRNKATETIAAPVVIQIYYDGERRWYPTGISVTKDKWSDTEGVFGRIDAQALNHTITKTLLQYQRFVDEVFSETSGFSFDTFALKIADLDVEDENIYSFIEKAIASRSDIRESSAEKHRGLLRALKKYGGITTFKAFNRQSIYRFDQWLHKCGYCQTTVHDYHKRMKTYINIAVREGKIDKNPYSLVKIKRGKSATIKYLTPDELESVESCKIPDRSISRVRDLFVFQCYTGLAYADLAKFDFSKVTKRNDKYILHDMRHKTNGDFHVVLLSPALKILQKYDYDLPVISNQQYNLRLKVLAKYAELEKPLTSHMARHTFACMALNNGATIQSVAKMLGHSRIETTQIYAKVLNKTVEREFDNLEAMINKRDASSGLAS